MKKRNAEIEVAKIKGNTKIWVTAIYGFVGVVLFAIGASIDPVHMGIATFALGLLAFWAAVK